MTTRSTHSTRRLVPILALALLIPAIRPALPAATASRSRAVATTALGPTAAVASAPEARLLLRTGDVAPVEGRVTLSGSGDLAELPNGSLLFRSQRDDSLLLLETGRVRILLSLGDRIDGCGTVSSISRFAAGADGSVAVLLTCNRVQAIVRLDLAGAPATVVLATGMALTIAGQEVLVGSLRGPALDDAGRLVAAVGSYPDVQAIVRQTPGSPVEILLASGDPLGAGLFTGMLEAPSVNGAGMVAFGAATSLLTQVIATLVPGSAPVVQFSVPIPGPPTYSQALAIAPPSVNNSGAVAFIWASDTGFQVLRVSHGAVETVAAGGDPAPGGGTFTSISWAHPVIDAAGGVFFSARRSDGRSGLYHSAGPTTPVAELDDPTEGDAVLAGIGEAPITSVLGGDGAVRFMASDTIGEGLFASRDGVLSVELRSGSRIDSPARFVGLDSSLSNSLPHLSAGPFLAEDGAIVFDALVTGRGRGLYLRAADGTVTPVAIEGDEAPEGGHFDGSRFVFHSLAAGQVAFLGSAPDSDRGSTLQLFSGPAGGPLHRIVGGGDFLPGYDAPISSLLPPSRINLGGAIIVPAFLADGRWILLFWDGATIQVFAVAGDTLPDGEVIVNPFPGAPGTLPPLLDDAGSLLVELQTESGWKGLYRGRIDGGIGSAVRVLGEGDLVQGGVLVPFGLRALSADPAGRLAFEAVPSGGTSAQTFSADVGPIPRLVKPPPDPNPPPPPPPGLPPETDGAWPRLAAMADGGVVHEVSTTSGFRRRLYFAVPRIPTDPDPDQAYDQVALVAPFLPSPDGGVFTRGVSRSFGPGFGGRPREPMRLGSDGDRFVVSVEPTSEGPEILVLFDLRPNHAPVAAAGPDQTIECTGPEGAEVLLDAGGSSDPDGDAIEFSWTGGPFGTAEGPAPIVTLPLGTWILTLLVQDPDAATSTDTVVVTVRDSVPPTIEVQAAPNRLWPPDGRLAPVLFGITTQDLCDPQPLVTLLSITSDDPKFDPAVDVGGASFGTDDRLVSLRSKRSGGNGGRTYSVAFEAADHSGNGATATGEVLVQKN